MACGHAKAVGARDTPRIASKHHLGSYINRGVPPLSNTLHLSNTSLSLVLFYLLVVVLEQGKATLESLAPWKKRPLGMNRDMSSSKVMLSYDIYSYTYELEYSYCVIILIYELVFSL